ncbi:unnamed protein product [Dovyalis caffra]|uniref:Uncharacterized protein n=1 Tax=Dovyalis caffra TaxID=77055 RepID=A0AAV1SF00_9ROSI|nr:unnamed protein product [Dovyalis caffra]
MASQAHQVFYIEDPIMEGLHYVMKMVPRDLFDLQQSNCSNIQDAFGESIMTLTMIRVLHVMMTPLDGLEKMQLVETLHVPPHILEAQQSNVVVEEDSDIDDTD